MAPIPNLAQTSAAAARNRDPILGVLREVLPSRGLVLEVASGTGEHAAYFAAHLPGLVWQPTDPDSDALASIEAHRLAAGLRNLNAPLFLDASAPPWPVAPADAVVAINMVHISPWAATLGLTDGAARVLGPGGVLFLYGPYREKGRPLAPGNAAFDASLRARNPEWGLREVEDLVAVADRHGLELARRVEMPANNLSLVFSRRS
jgi:SAM-dependent methyltransferase